ncbi:alpha-(1,3)-fucosyltransferase C-like [Paramacrobiotus metropolitanus]|uniref:alpha-(1,3)-fucosyltransferase C-like n=1 Tax=Paramacrobiotus metropolitanus TaxID=2943436 RepID=UPI0024459D9A|nr:alpha-(1,3)-fucosyltransferase C-like [Paramacrobiotus metropolitanus]
MTVEVLPMAPLQHNNNASIVTRRKMGSRFLTRWTILAICLCAALIYFLDIPSRFDQGKIITTFISGGTVDPLVLDIQQQINSRKQSAAQASNLFPVDPDAIKTVLFWTQFFGVPDSRGTMGSKLFDGCPVKQCTATNDKGNLNKADAVIFHALDVDPKALPGPRGSKQHYVFLIGESPANLPNNRVPDTPLGFFDMTHTYRLNSDILGHYMYSAPLEQAPKNFAEGKNKLVAWYVSNCHTHSKRENYVKQLQKYVNVDVYGKCGSLKCSRNDEQACNQLLKKEYKFYLAFENSICQDYVTEKFTNALSNYVVPVALGGGNMTIYPPNSYIHVDDFPSVKALADYLQYLNNNDTAYNEYMKWRFDPVLVSSHGRYSAANSGWCELCEKLHDPAFEAKEYPNAKQWYMEGGHCREGKW